MVSPLSSASHLKFQQPIEILPTDIDSTLIVEPFARTSPVRLAETLKYESDILPHVKSGFSKIPNLYVRNIDGILTLKGKIHIHFKDGEGKLVSKWKREQTLNSFKDLNRRTNTHAIDIEYVDASLVGSINNHARHPANIYVVYDSDANIVRKCGPNTLGCYSQNTIYSKRGMPNKVAQHELGHALGWTHNFREGSLMASFRYGDGISSNEINKLVDFYNESWRLPKFW
jgi:hypothetical protein